MPRSRRAVPLFFVAFAVVVTLVGCAPAVHAHAGGSKGGSGGSGGSAHAPTPTPTPTLANPVVRVPLTCDQLAPQANVSAVLGVPVQTSTFFNSPLDLETYADIQDGARMCFLTPTNAADESEFQVLVMPDITAARWNEDKSSLALGSTITSPFGANTYVNCQSSSGGSACNLDALIGSTWLSVTDFGDKMPTASLPATLAKFKPLLQSAFNQVKAATIAEPAWADPAATAVNVDPDWSKSDVPISKAIGFPFHTQVYVPDVLANGPLAEADYPVHFQEFGGGGSHWGITETVLPAGAWAWSQITSAAASASAYQSESGIGDQAISFSQTGGDTKFDSEIIATKGHNLISIDVQGDNATTGAQDLAIARKAAIAVLAEIS